MRKSKANNQGPILMFFFFGADIQKYDDLNHIRRFISRIPENIKKIYDSNSTNLLDLLNKMYGSVNIPGIANDYKELMYSAEKDIEYRCKIVAKEINEGLYEKYESVGLTKQQLKLKGSIFTNLWQQMETLVQKGIVDILDSRVIKSLKNVLNYLMDFLDSFLGIHPLLEAVKEFIGLLIGSIDLVDNYEK